VERTQIFRYSGGTVMVKHNFSCKTMEQWEEDKFSCMVVEEEWKVEG
jgi:hypothetical protein